MSGPRFEPMTASQILDRACRLYRDDFLRYVAIVAVMQVPTGLLMVAGRGIAYSSFTGMGPPGPSSDPITALVSMLVGSLMMMAGGLLTVVGAIVSMAAIARCMSARYLGGDLTVLASYRSLAPSAGWLALLVLLSVPSLFVLYLVFGVAVLVVVLVGVGIAAANLGPVVTVLTVVFISLVATAALIAALLAWSVLFSLSVQAMAIEGLNTIAAIGRSAKLAWGNLRRSIGTALLASVLVLVPGTVLVSVGMGLTVWIFSPWNMMALAVAGQSLGLIMQVLIMPLWGAAMLLLYYDLRVRKEGFDLEMLARSFGPVEAASNART